MSIEGERVISKMIPQLYTTFVDETTSLIEQNPGSGWEEIVPHQIYQWHSVLDLTGISTEHLTTFFTGLSIQEPLPFMGKKQSAIPGENILWALVTDCITNEPLDANIVTLPFVTVEGQTPGFLSTTTNWDDVIMGSWREIGVNQEFAGHIGTLAINQNGSFGSAEASASRKLYFTRTLYLAPFAVPGDYIRLPPARFVAGIAIAEEKEHEYLMRLKRSCHNEQ